MFDLKFTEEQNLLRDMVRDFANNELKPIAAEIDEKEEVPIEIIKKIGELGLFGAAIPSEYGGSDFGEIGYLIIQEEISRACLSTATLIGAHSSIGMNSIYLGGDEELKQRFLPALCSGEKICAFGLTEQGAGSDAFNLKTNAVEDGNYWILNGEKQWITNGPIADVVAVYARTKRGISAFIVEKGMEGFSHGAPEKKMGIRGSKTSTLKFENVRIPKENMIGKEGSGFVTAMHVLNMGRLGLGAPCLGAMKELLEISTVYSKNRVQFGEPISHFEGVQFMLAEMATLTYTLESMLYRTAAIFEAGKLSQAQSAMVKLFSSEALDRVSDLAMQ
ncbi:MAG TPA: acyl-CoA dehydrogenase family protein, partial [Bacteroidota bacterium]|nr:acyl-CoA dehydrogenase family protein [Bacteroidota bacterium]